MNFSKKNHEHKIINIKSVSKKIILGVVFVFASFTTVNANSNAEIIESDIDCSEVYDMVYNAVLYTTMNFELAFDIAMDAENNCLAEQLFGER